MSGPAVVIVESGGIPVTPVDRGAPPLLSVESGGVPVTLTARGVPFVISGYTPNPPVMGALDYANPALDAFTAFSRPFDLAATSAVLGFVCDYTGNPTITITHGGEPLTILHQERFNGVLALVAAGTGLTIESANLVISATGGNLNGGALRFNEMINVGPGLSGWEGGATAAAAIVSTPAVTGASGGIVKAAYGSRTYDTHHASTLLGADDVWKGFLTTGPIAPTDYGPSGAWTLEAGWSWDGTDLVHTGPASIATIPFPVGAGPNTSGRADVEIADGALCGMTIYNQNSYTTYRGPYNGPIYNSVNGRTSSLSVRATGSVRVKSVWASGASRGVTWVFGSTPAVDGDVIEGKSTARAPDSAISAAEILGQDY